MSEVKRYSCTNGKAQYCYGCYQMDEDSDGQWVRVDDYDAAQSELAALREELANNLDIMEGQKNSIINLSAKVKDLKPRLTAAEQRNAELLDLLRDIKDAPGGSQFRKHIEAVLTKPTESGASDTSKPPVGSVVIVCGGIKATVKAHHPDGLVVGAGDGYVVNEWRASE